MIKANEFRIGNKVWKETIGIVEILGIELHSTDGEILYIANEGMEFKHRIKIDEVTPIPLTPEILEKCGFEKKNLVFLFFIIMIFLCHCWIVSGNRLNHK